MFCHHHTNNEAGLPNEQSRHTCPNHRLAPIFIAVLIIFFFVWSVESIISSKLKYNEFKNLKSERTISVSAEGKATAVPDLATINFSIITEAKTAKGAQNKNAEKMNKVIDYLKTLGIDKKDIKTTSYSLYPKYDYPDGKSVLVGYTLTNSISVKMRDFDKMGDLIANSVELGINQVGDVQFSIENPDALKAQALSQAMENAKEKAIRLAEKAGVKLGKIVTFSENQNGQIYPYYMKTAEMGIGGGGSITPQLEQGSQEITVTANIVFEIE